MSDMNRRQFLQALSATFAAIALPMPNMPAHAIEIDEAMADVPITAENPLGELVIDGVVIPVISVDLSASVDIDEANNGFVRISRPMGKPLYTLSFSTPTMDVQDFAFSNKYHNIVFRPKFLPYVYTMKAMMSDISVSCKSNGWIVCDCEMYVDGDSLTRV